MLDRGTKYTPAPMAAVPLIPGLVSTQRHFIGRANFHKGQVLERMAQGRLVDVANDSNSTGATSKANEVSPATTTVQRATSAATATATATAKPSPPPASSAFRAAASQPAWLAHDRQVLRFFGYFLEPVAADDTQAKAPLVRRVVLLFYLSDHSLAVSEPRVANSGLAQGAFLKRTQAATTSSGERFTPRDFSVGGRIKLYGRTLHLVDCDAATRAYYAEALAAPQGDALKYPDDASSQLDEIAALKTRLAERRSRETDSGAARARQFHAHAGGAVLRFFVSWRDPHPLYPETRRYALHYYLSDDTLELVEPKREREGRGHFAVLLSRRRVESVQARALRCGEVVEVCARRFLLEDCDAFTRAYFLETFGVTQEPHAPHEEKARDAAAKWKLFRAVPESEADAGDRMGPRFRRRDEADEAIEDTAAREDKQLRFRARLLGPRAGGRELVVTFFLADGTLSVFEPRVANSGVAGGRFLDRGRFRKAATAASNGGAYVKAQDLFVGAVLAFAFAPQQQLELIEADRQTLAYCESHADAFPFSDVQAVLASVAANATTSMAAMRRAWRVADAARDGSLAVGDARRVLETLGLARALNAQQLVTLCRAFEDGDGDEQHAGGQGGPRPFLYDDFCDALALAMAPSSSPSSTSSDVLMRLRSCRALRRLLHEADPQRQRVVATAELMRVAAAAKLPLSHSEALALATRFPGSHRHRHRQLRDVVVDYNALCDRVFDGGDVDTDQKPSAALPHKERERRTDRQQGMAKKHHSDEEEDDNDDGELGDWATPNQHSLGQRQNDMGDCHSSSDDEFAHFGSDDGGDANLPADEPTPRGRQAPVYESPRRHHLNAPRVSPPALTRPLPARATYASAVPLTPTPSKGAAPHFSDTRVVALLRRVFSDRKYLLRKALRDRDADKSGLLGEEAFMAAVLAVEPRLSDDDTYLLADVYFPTNNSVIDYNKLLEGAFRT